MKVSIILPVYNVEKYIDETMESIINQTMSIEDIEVIFIDDNSTDNSKEIIKKYINEYKHFKGVFLESNSGSCGKPRNVGIDYITGEYVIFGDPDDIFLEDACEKLYNCAKENKSDIVIGKFVQFDSKGLSYDKMDKVLTEKIINCKIEECPELLKTSYNMMKKIYKTDFVKEKKLLFPENVISQDSVFTVESFFKARRISYIPEFIFKYRIRQEKDNLSATQRINKKYFEDFIFVRNRVIELYEEYEKINYIDTRYARDVNWLLTQFERNIETSNENIIKICNIISGFLTNFNKYNISINSEKDKLVNLIINKKYDDIFRLINRNKNYEV